MGVTTQFAGSKDFYIADNVFIGRDDPRRVLGWAGPANYGAHQINSYFAIKVYGSGHVIAHNAVAFFHDGISVCTHGVPDANPNDRAVAIDIYNNDIHVTGDDFIEADGGVHNIRVMRNRGVNAAHTGLSAQPIFGGPAYYIRNVVYNTPVALKFSNPAGVIVYHNTIIAENRTAQRVSNAHFRNNLFLGTNAPDRHLGARRPDGVLDVRLRRLPAEPGREGAVHVVRAEAGHDGGLRRAAEPGTGLRDTRGPGQGDRRRKRTASKWTTTSSSRCAAPPRPDSSQPGRPFEAIESELHAEGGRQSRRRRRAPAERQRWFLGQGAGPRSTRGRRADAHLRAALAERRALL